MANIALMQWASDSSTFGSPPPLISPDESSKGPLTKDDLTASPRYPFRDGDGDTFADSTEMQQDSAIPVPPVAVRAGNRGGLTPKSRIPMLAKPPSVPATETASSSAAIEHPTLPRNGQSVSVPRTQNGNPSRSKQDATLGRKAKPKSLHSRSQSARSLRYSHSAQDQTPIRSPVRRYKDRSSSRIKQLAQFKHMEVRHEDSGIAAKAQRWHLELRSPARSDDRPRRYNFSGG